MCHSPAGRRTVAFFKISRSSETRASSFFKRLISAACSVVSLICLRGCENCAFHVYKDLVLIPKRSETSATEKPRSTTWATASRLNSSVNLIPDITVSLLLKLPSKASTNLGAIHTIQTIKRGYIHHKHPGVQGEIHFINQLLPAACSNKFGGTKFGSVQLVQQSPSDSEKAAAGE